MQFSYVFTYSMTGFPPNPAILATQEERAVLPSSSVAVITGLRPLFLWIPVTPVIPADGCHDWGDENDGAGVSDGCLWSMGWHDTA